MLLQSTATMATIKSLDELAAACYDDPLGFVQMTYPWGQSGTFLADSDGPDVWQTEELEALGEHVRRTDAPYRCGIASGHGIGKEQVKRAIIPTPCGDRCFGDLRIGDTIFGVDGRPQAILGVYDQGYKPTYRVTFDDGTSLLVGREHLWAVRGRGERRFDRGWITLTTEEIMRRGVKRPNGCALARQWEVPRHDALGYPSREVPVDPYTLGFWLGDGSKNKGQVTKPDEEPISRIRQGGYRIREMTRSYSNCREWSILGLLPQLRIAGVLGLGSHERYVPDIYKYNAPHTQLSVLQGLLDSDGTVDKTGKPSFTSTSETLAHDVAWLVRSLGGKARVGKSKPRGYRKEGAYLSCRPCYDVNFTMPSGVDLFSIPFKRDRYRPTSQERYLVKWIDDIEPTGLEEDCQCIRVENPDGLYVAGDGIVTHNTTFLAGFVMPWFITTRPNPQIVCTANTQQQLRTKTWRELAKWHAVSLFRDWFTWTATMYYHREHAATWFAASIPWSEHKAEAFQGTHESNVLMIFDEASIIPPIIWETTEGAMTQPGSFHFAFGNPTQNTGMFRSIFPGGLLAHRWRTKQIDSRDSRLTNKAELAEWEETYGEDSDFFRIRVRGMFPKQSSDQLIGEDTVTQAAARLPLRSEHYPIIMGADIARMGDDANTVYIRRGNEILFATEWREEKTPVITSRLSQLIKSWNPDAVFIDLGNVGAAIVDQLELLGHDVVGVNFGGHADKPLEYANKRTEIAARTRDWLETTGSLMSPPGCERWVKELKAQLVLPKKDYEEKTQRLILEPKKKMRKRGLSSPDHFDGLGLTFAYHVVKRNRAEELGRQLEAARYEPIERW